MLLAAAWCVPVDAAVPPAAAKAPVPADAWPRQITLSGAAVLIYAPQVTGWVGNQIDFRSALAIKPTGAKGETFGVVTATARTRVDRVSRMVSFDGIQITSSDFPTLPDRGKGYAAELQTQLATVSRTIALDRLQASLAASGFVAPTVAVQNDPPRVIVSNTPAILVPIAGAPVWKPVPGAPSFQRVINTRALILKSASEPQIFMKVYDGWLMANSLDGPWTQPFIPPTGIDAVAKQVAATGVVDVLDGGARASPKPSLAQGIPAVYTAQVPAELVVFKGAPEFAPIVGTGLMWATNTTGDVLRVGAAGDYYVLLAGRWFRSAALTGPWSFVASNALPPDFAKIPPTSLAGAVLPTIAGTPQAQEAAIEIAIPQTATVPLKNGPSFAATYDGAPQFVPVPGTTLSRASNSRVPVIQTAPNAYYAVRAGIWFTAAQPTGPWSIATSVPASIYTIPPSSPIFYVTYVKIYGATPDVVYTGYTPGYLGANVAPTGNVVFGTGYAYPSWIGDKWYAAPPTYGVGATPVYNPRVGYTYAFAVGLATVAWQPPAAKTAQTATLHPSYWGGYPCCGTASANVYRVWARDVQSKSRVKDPRQPDGGASARANAAPAAAMQAPANASAPAAPQAAYVPGSASSPPETRIALNAAPPPPPMAPAQYDARTPPAPRGYDMSMVTTQDSPAALRGSAKQAPPPSISANEYYASLKANGGFDPDSVANTAYTDNSGAVYRSAGSGWQRHGGDGWQSTPAPPPEVSAQAQASSRADAAAMQAGSYGMNNTTRFSGDPSDGWTARDAGDGGYSRTLGGDGGISAERYAYNTAVLNNAFDIAANGGWWGQGVYIGGVGWGGVFGD